MKIFVLLSRVPFPLDKGDKLRAYNFIKYLSKKNEIILACLNDTILDSDDVAELQKYCTRIVIYKITKKSIFSNLLKAFFTGMPFQEGYFYNSKVKRSIHSLINEIKPDHIFCQLIRTSEYVKDINIPKTLDYQDALAQGVKRRIEKAPFYMKFILKMEYKRLLKYEHDIFDSFNHKLIISEPDKLLIAHPDNKSIHVIKNGLDHDYYKPIKSEKVYDLIFSGNMAYPPNIDAAEYLINDILPLVKREYPTIKVLIAGADPHKRLKKLASDTITITGWVDDMRECYTTSRIFIAPMRIGTGLQNKLLEAMSMKLPCITTSLANDSLGAKNDSEILVGNTAAELAQHIIKLMSDEITFNNISRKGCNYVNSNYSWKTEISKLEHIISNKH